jgi:hypothetical protein
MKLAHKDIRACLRAYLFFEIIFEDGAEAPKHVGAFVV